MKLTKNTVLLISLLSISACKTTGAHNAIAMYTFEEACESNTYYLKREIKRKIVNADEYYAAPKEKRESIGRTLPGKLYYCADKPNDETVTYTKQDIINLDKELIYTSFSSAEKMNKYKSK